MHEVTIVKTLLSFAASHFYDFNDVMFNHNKSSKVNQILVIDLYLKNDDFTTNNYIEAQWRKHIQTDTT